VTVAELLSVKASSELSAVRTLSINKFRVNEFENNQE